MKLPWQVLLALHKQSKPSLNGLQRKQSTQFWSTKTTRGPLGTNLLNLLSLVEAVGPRLARAGTIRSHAYTSATNFPLGCCVWPSPPHYTLHKTTSRLTTLSYIHFTSLYYITLHLPTKQITVYAVVLFTPL